MQKKLLFLGAKPKFERLTRAAPVSTRWQVEFAASGPCAMEKLGKQKYDIVVSDRQVDNQDADRMLRAIGASFPAVARLALTDMSPMDARRASSLVSLQLISESVANPAFEQILERSSALYAIVTNDRVRDLVGRLDSLPSVPRTFFELQKLAADPDSGAADIARAVQLDPALSLKVLQVVNSVQFGLRRSISSLPHAVSYLGVELLKAIVLSAHILSCAERTRVRGFCLESFQDYSLRIGRLAQQFLSGRGQGEEAFTAALLQNVGLLVLAMRHPEGLTAALLRTAESGESPELVERELLGVTHAEVGAYLLWSWGIPFAILETVAFHHQPHMLSGTALEIVGAVQVADALWGALGCGESAPILDTSTLERANLVSEVPRWRGIVEDAVRSAHAE